MIIRNMQPQDIEVVALLEQECFSRPWSTQALKESLEREDTIFLVAEMEDGRVGGYIGMYHSFGEGEITNVAVSATCRKKGLGDALVSAMQTQAKEKNVTQIFLEVRKSNEPALSLYNKKNFRIIGERKNFYEQPQEDAILMSCDI